MGTSCTRFSGAAKAALAAAAALALGAAPALALAANPADPGNLSGVWMRTGNRSTIQFRARDRIVLTAEGQRPPLKPEAQALLDKRLDDSDKGIAFADSVSQCLPGGVPKMMMIGPYPVEIVATPDKVILLFEELNNFRLVSLNKPHRPDPDPGYMGDSVGHWEGDTLVVDTIGLNDKTTLDAAGTPHGENLHVVERFRRTDADTMEYVATIEDPDTFTRPWSAKTIFKQQRDYKLLEFICDNNRNATFGDPDQQGFSAKPLGQ